MVHVGRWWALQVLLREHRQGIDSAGLRPKSFDELFKAADGKIKVREEHTREGFVKTHSQHYWLLWE